MPRATQLRNGRIGLAAALLVVPGVTLGLALASGGFYPDSVSVAVVAVILVLALRVALSRGPFSGVTPGVAGVAVALVAFVAWTLISGSWGTPARATFEYDRNLLYASLFVLTGFLGRSVMRARLLLWGMTAVTIAVSAAAAATWLLPDVFAVSSSIARDRLAWPTSYWNATGLIAALGLVWSSSLSFSAGRPSSIRVLGAMAAPVCAATLIFTVSRGAVAVAALGLVMAAVTIRSSATPGGIAAVAPAVAVSVAIAVGVSGLNVVNPPAPAVSAGHRAALMLVAVAFAAGAVRLVLLGLDARLARTTPPWTRGQLRVALGVLAAVLVAAFVALGGPRAVGHAAHRFATAKTSSVAASQRLTQLGGNGRLDGWRVAWDDGFLRHPVIGTGAGTYATVWTRYGPRYGRILNAHSLYFEELAELGIVGAGLLLAAMTAIFIALARRARGPEREPWAALLAAGVMWAVHAGVDWDWQMSAVTAWFFACGGLALSAPADRPRRELPPTLRVAIALGCLLLTITPVVVWRSQTKLDQAVAALERGNCIAAQKDALASNAALRSRPDPFEVISYCDAGARDFPLALSSMQAAEQRDPNNWEYRYSDALISAVAGRDPRPAARAALALYPHSPLTRAAARAFGRGGPRQWRRFAIAAPLPVPRPNRGRLPGRRSDTPPRTAGK